MLVRPFGWTRTTGARHLDGTVIIPSSCALPSLESGAESVDPAGVVLPPQYSEAATVITGPGVPLPVGGGITRPRMRTLKSPLLLSRAWPLRSTHGAPPALAPFMSRGLRVSGVTSAGERTIRVVPALMPWSTAIELQGAGGEPVDFARTLLSHGVADLLPNVIAPDGSSLETVLASGGRAWMLVLTSDGPGSARLSAAAGSPPPPKRAQVALEAGVRHMLRLDEDLSGFYEATAADPSLAWVAAGAGRMLRSPTVFEDLMKTICTTNCAWSGTVRMVSALVSELGLAAAGVPVRRTFPTPEAMAAADDGFYRDVARAGYRGPYLRTIAVDVAEGRLELEALGDPAIADDEVAETLLELPGVGPYALAHMMMLLGRYRPLILDSWTRPTYRRLAGRPRVTDKGIERAFRRYREFAGLAFWLTLTEDWLTRSGGGA